MLGQDRSPGWLRPGCLLFTGISVTFRPSPSKVNEWGHRPGKEQVRKPGQTGAVPGRELQAVMGDSSCWGAAESTRGESRPGGLAGPLHRDSVRAGLRK